MTFGLNNYDLQSYSYFADILAEFSNLYGYQYLEDMTQTHDYYFDTTTEGYVNVNYVSDNQVAYQANTSRSKTDFCSGGVQYSPCNAAWGEDCTNPDCP